MRLSRRRAFCFEGDGVGKPKRHIKLANLTPDQRRLVLALIRAQRAADEARAKAADG